MTSICVYSSGCHREMTSVTVCIVVDVVDFRATDNFKTYHRGLFTCKHLSRSYQ